MTAACERIRSAVAELRRPHAGSELGVLTVSIGVATVLPSPAHRAEDLVAAADAALYRAKAAGRNAVRVRSL